MIIVGFVTILLQSTLVVIGNLIRLNKVTATLMSIYPALFASTLSDCRGEPRCVVIASLSAAAALSRDGCNITVVAPLF